MAKAISKKKCFVLDTNVILHDSSCINHFDEHDIVIPITVLEELDTFKKGNDTLNFHAREFARSLDALSHDHLFDTGLELGEGRGTISIRLESEFHPDIERNFSRSQPDHRILNSAYTLQLERKNRNVVLVTKDVNLRMKARSVGIPVEDYTSDRVTDLTTLDRGIRMVPEFESKLIDKLYSLIPEIDAADLPEEMAPQPNECFILRRGSKSALACYDQGMQLLRA